MKCDVSKMRQLAELWMHDAPASPALMLGDQRLAYEALQAADEITRLQAIIERLRAICRQVRDTSRLVEGDRPSVLIDYVAWKAAAEAAGGGE